MSDFVTCNVPCTILVTSDSARERINALAIRHHADAVDPIWYKCLRCHCEWDMSPCTDPKTVSCSNCYSSRVVVTVVRLAFDSWGEQNGGEREQRKRYLKCLSLTAKAMKAVEDTRRIWTGATV